ncbi:MAG: hypothetical protein A2275_08085 [Bacteroidetes bacterium RIFOXYA12_FULL_35_11]|nr:MAG: hypothetical protein A2X01_06330 [Bacteroidetes bacterium GWF2_35_48]OFY75387.1 MAG: hypothetical protein A2275_08085 [Bacteroidetes bacterium RIFOXYA12_FULL_35_11]OFY92941.1 MAG: hypothetical protein A2491_20150 [Bacteroidetes bacterium RIFOXYC12_FULL_35_7]OFY97833.1 MAG: hypothetical protein A2309_01465 [Bacteroidetes bacterium RIFOXYB2_FULL_35_7]HBX53558.1 hypothetical protein [Bacteroidales bacterium]
MNKSIQIKVKGVSISVFKVEKEDYISLTDMVKGFGDDTMIYSVSKKTTLFCLTVLVSDKKTSNTRLSKS